MDIRQLLNDGFHFVIVERKSRPFQSSRYYTVTIIFYLDDYINESEVYFRTSDSGSNDGDTTIAVISKGILKTGDSNYDIHIVAIKFKTTQQ